MSTAIRARGYEFRHASRKQPAFRNVDFSIEAGEKVLLVGASGAGKSTLLSAIAGLLNTEHGEAAGELAVQGRVGMVLQDPDAQVIAAQVGDDVAFGCENLQLPREEILRRVPKYLAAVGLDFPWEHNTAHLSGGQQQRLALAGVLAMGADIVCLDEPTANLDPAGIAEVVTAVQAIEDATVILVEHRIATWAAVVDRIIVLGPDGVIATGAPEDILDRYGAMLAEQGIWVPGHDPTFPEAQRVARDEMPAAITTTDLVLAWDTPGNVHPLNLALPAGQSTVFCGPNGSGKSTCLLTLGGLLAPRTGSVHIAGMPEPPHTWPARRLARKIGTVFQDPEVQFFQRTVREELLGSAMVAYAKKRPWSKDTYATQRQQAEQRADRMLEELGLAALAQANPFTLSGGQKRRLSLASALVVTPDILLLDEPTFGQDRNTFITLVHMLQAARSAGTTIVSVSHDELYRKALGNYVYDFAA